MTTKAPIEKEDTSGTEVTMKFPAGTDPRLVEETMKAAQVLASKSLKETSIMDEAQADYMKNGGKRWVAKVESLRKGINHFELYVEDLNNTSRPIRISGLCSVMLKEGLTKRVIDTLMGAHHWEQQNRDYISESKNIGLTTKKVKVYHYRVETFGEVKGPKPVGKVGHEIKDTWTD